MVAPTVQIFGEPEGMMTWVRNVGTTPIFQLAALFQSVLTVPVQVATSRMMLANAVSVQPAVLVAIRRYVPGGTDVGVAVFHDVVRPVVVYSVVRLVVSP